MSGTIPGWMFSVTADETVSSVEISQQGGIPVEFFSDRTVVQPLLTAEACVTAASQWLEEQGYESMVLSYYHQEDGILTANFAYSQEDVICYPDLVKVSVAMDDGTIVGLDARSYLMNHTERTLDSAAVTLQDALQQVPDWVEVISDRLAVIPSDGLYDTLCYEITGQTDSGRHVIYYVNASSGHTEKIFLLVEDENGTLVL
jgi:germination protein YpeB